MKTRTHIIIGLLIAMGLTAHAQSHYIGEVVTAPDGQQGIVFYVSNDGTDYWLVALNDLPRAYQWGDMADIPDLENMEPSFFMHYNPCGLEATETLKNYQGSNPNYAASAVNTKQYWCIPSTGQASKLYAAMPYIQDIFAQHGGTMPGVNYDHYWTSTEYSYNQAYIIYLGTEQLQGGALSQAYKDESLGVRPVWSMPNTSDLPSVGQISAPEEICSGSALTLEAPETQNANAEGWQIATNANFEDPQPYNGEGLDDTYDGWYLRYYAQNMFGTTYSNAVQISILPANITTIDAFGCESYIWNGQTYTQSGVYEQMLEAQNGCDSIVTLHLSLGEPSATDFIVFACNNYTWNGTEYTESGDYEQAFTSLYGCDSIVTMHLTIGEPSVTDFSAVACDSYTWNGTVYTESGDYMKTFYNIYGCDSVVIMHLTIEGFGTMPDIEGEAEVDTYLMPTSVYTQPGYDNATYQWILLPAQAGSVSGYGNTAIVTWSTEYQGQATLGVGVATYCGEGYNTLDVSVKNSFGTNESSINAKLFPNPTSGKLFIEATAMQHITIVDALGQVVLDKNLEADSTSIDMAQYGAGVYVVRIQTQDGICTKHVEVK